MTGKKVGGCDRRPHHQEPCVVEKHHGWQEDSVGGLASKGVGQNGKEWQEMALSTTGSYFAVNYNLWSEEEVPKHDYKCSETFKNNPGIRRHVSSSSPRASRPSTVKAHTSLPSTATLQLPHSRLPGPAGITISSAWKRGHRYSSPRLPLLCMETNSDCASRIRPNLGECQIHPLQLGEFWEPVSVRGAQIRPVVLITEIVRGKKYQEYQE